jgi:hypothetical protein
MSKDNFCEALSLMIQFFVPTCITTIDRLLRRTLQRSEIL